MKRAVMSIVLIMSIGIGFSQAQEPDLTETYSDERVTFQYPARWVVALDENGDPTLSNKPPESTSLLTPEAGIVKINIVPFDIADSNDMGIAIDDFKGGDIALFMAGLYSGTMMASYQFVASFASAFSEEPIEPDTTLSRFEVLDSGYLVEITMRTGETGVDMLIIATETYLVVVGTSATELTQWTEIILAITDTVSVSE